MISVLLLSILVLTLSTLVLMVLMLLLMLLTVLLIVVTFPPTELIALFVVSALPLKVFIFVMILSPTEVVWELMPPTVVFIVVTVLFTEVRLLARESPSLLAL